MTGHFHGEPLASILETSIDAVFTIDAKGHILWANGASERMFGWTRGELMGRNISLLVPSPLKERHDDFLAGYRPEKGFTHILGAGRWLEAERKDGSRLPVEVGLSTFVEDGQRYFTGFVRDISDRRAAEEKLQYLATHDQMTGLPNARPLAEAANRALAAGKPLAMVVIILVGLYQIGERHGRDGLEHALRTVSERLAGVMNGDGMLARLEGELLAATTPDPAPEALAARLCAAIRQPIPWGSVELHLGAAAGVAKAEGSFHSASDLIRVSYAVARDTLARHASGGVAVFTPDIGRRLEREARIEERLRAAVAAGGLSLALQPKVRAVDGQILGAEALARWHDALLGPVSPAEFIPIAERAGIIGDLTLWMMRRSLTEAAAWQQAGLDLTVAVNISAIDLRQPNLVADMAEALTQSGCEPTRLVIELTESAVAEDPAAAITRLSALKDLGASLSLDDFGTGYSSLSHLRRFPIDSLKIDQSFVVDTPHNPDAVAIARTVVALARSLGMETVAEGVETRPQAALLRELGVNILQGFLYGRPMAPEAFRALAAEVPTAMRTSR